MAIVALEKQPGARGLNEARWSLGRAQLGQGKHAAAMASFERARADALAASDVVLAAQVRYSRGVALWGAGRRAEGRAEVAASLAEMPEGRPELRRVIQAWLDAHR